jgi:hypothetical protein
MNADEFRAIALSHAGAVESEHMSHPDFRVGGKIFATLGYPDARHGVVMLPPDEQPRFVREHPETFTPVKGAWGERGSTQVLLDRVSADTLREAMTIAWRKRAPKKLPGDGRRRAPR